jgi:hypothetical protein
LLLSNTNDSKGILSYQFIGLLQDGQKDLSLAMLLLKGRRYMHTLQKLPNMLPKINAAK